MKNVCYNIDNMEFMKNIPDKYYELAIVDPPYGCLKSTNPQLRKAKMGKQKWDIKPGEKYFVELFRISKNQIIWGANYFNIPTPKSVIFWDKNNHFPLYGDGELAYFYGKLKCMREIKRNLGGVIKITIDINRAKIHPAQKPVELYLWLLKNYAKPGDKIFDSHVGSGSIRIACDELGFEFEGCELNKEYWEAQEKRFKNHKDQLLLF